MLTNSKNQDCNLYCYTDKFKQMVFERYFKPGYDRAVDII